MGGNDGARSAICTLGGIELLCKAVKMYPYEEALQGLAMAALYSCAVDNEENTKAISGLSGAGFASSAVLTHGTSPKVVEFGNLLLQALQPWRKNGDGEGGGTGDWG